MVGSTLMKGIVGDGASIGIIGAVHNVQAAIYLSINHFWYSSQSVLMELFSYVRPEYRRSSNAKVLLEFAKESSRRLDTPLLASVISNDRTEEKIRLFQRSLGKPAGAFFLLNAKTGH